MMDLRKILFKYRSYTPIPFIVAMILCAKPTIISILGGLVIVFIGEFIRLWGVSLAGSETRTTSGVGASHLVTSGPFAYVRNPLYLGNVTIYVGVAIMSWAAFPLLPVIILSYFLFQYTLIINLEEEYLIKTYGTEYQRYMKAVPRFFPTFKKFQQSGEDQPKLVWKKGIESERRTFQAIAIVMLIIIVLWILRKFFDIKMLSNSGVWFGG